MKRWIPIYPRQFLENLAIALLLCLLLAGLMIGLGWHTSASLAPPQRHATPGFTPFECPPGYYASAPPDARCLLATP